MLSTISILPKSIKERYMAHRRLKLYATCLVIVFSVFLFILVSLFMVLSFSGSQLLDVKRERSAVVSEINSLEHYEQIYNETLKKEEQIAKASASVPDFELFISNLGATIPDGVWIEDIQTINGEASKLVKVKGIAMNHYQVADWLQDFETLQGVEDVRCTFSVEVTVSGIKMIQYELNAVILPVTPFGSSTVAKID